ncbi:hypothetical protein KFL_013080030 [Klebsormidium nitens]|uniref:Uncharacterized protein n=1 Tax=Klebsormidium nitens TaxID=105231 RepID=A0A1Y1IW39_KLENI|nr:hypothetical protein KFL_013080030 [Klebsormidium nitens]|eukprot:GAQ93116.1 hypothetical protein KFL_013080030 [Klebsormidium nitens]
MDGAKKAPTAQKKAQAESVKEKREELVEIELEFDEAGLEPQAEKAKNGATGEPLSDLKGVASVALRGASLFDDIHSKEIDLGELLSAQRITALDLVWQIRQQG